MKGLADQPHPLHREIDVGEDAENASAMRGPRGKGIEVQQVVALGGRQVAAALLQRTEAGIVHLIVAGIGREERTQERRHLLRVVPHDLVQAFAVGRIVGHAAQHVRARPVADVLVEARLGLLLREQELAVRWRQIEGYASKEQDAAVLQLGAVLLRLGLGIGGLPSRSRVVANRHPWPPRVHEEKDSAIARRGAARRIAFRERVSRQICGLATAQSGAPLPPAFDQDGAIAGQLLPLPKHPKGTDVQGTQCVRDTQISLT